MTQVIFQPSGSDEAQKHFRDTVAKPVELAAHRDLLGEHLSPLRQRFPSGSARIWGVQSGSGDVNVGKYDRIVPGDVVLFLGMKQAFAKGTVAYLWRSRPMARRLWGRDFMGDTWELMYAITDFEMIDVSYDIINRAAGYAPNYPHQGFNVLDEVRSETVLAAIGVSITVPPAGSVWSDGEISIVVGAYFEILAAEMGGTAPVKARYIEELLRRLPGRSRGSIEYKLENVSAVLNELGLPWIDGYKPASNYQKALRDAVLQRLANNPDETAEIEAAQNEVPDMRVSGLSTDDVRVPPPTGTQKRSGGGGGLASGPKGALRDAANKALGDAGEVWVMDLEIERLRRAGREDLASRVLWVAQEIGDAPGYDVLSFDEEGHEMHIEVKTTNLGIRATFFVTRHEFDVSREAPDAYWLFRVFDFKNDPHLYDVQGALDQGFSLEPSQYVARRKPAE